MADIKIIINGDPSGGANALRTIRRELDATKTAAEGTSGSFRRIGETAAGFVSAQAVIAGVSKVFDVAKGSIIGFNSQMQNASVAFTTLLGSADAARNMLSDLALFARQTPFQFPELLTNTQRLLAFGFAAKDIIPIMTAIGDAASAMGNVTAEGLQRITIAIGQIATRGKVQTQEMLQLTEAGIPAFRILADGLGVTTGALSQMLEKGLIPADRGLKILLEGMENRAPGAMQKMSTTWTGAVSNIKDSLQQLTAGAFKPFFDQLTTLANKFADFLMSDRVARFARDVNAAMDALAKGLSAAFAGKDAEADRYFAQFARAAASAGKQLELMLLQVADVLSPLAGLMAEGFANLAQAAIGWGADLITSFTVGLVTAAGSVLASALNEIFTFIAGWFPHSPAKEGPFRRIHEMGADLLNSLFQGMSMADFSALDTVMEGVRAALTTAFGNGGGEDVDFIPRLIGSQAGVAQALDDLKQFGDIASSTIDLLTANLGEASTTILGLIRNVAELGAKDAEIGRLRAAIDEWDVALAEVDVQIGRVKRGMDEIRRRYDEQRRPLEDAIRATDRYYDGLIRNSDLAIRKIQAQIAAMERLRGPQSDALDAEERNLNVRLAQQALGEAENAHNVRRVDLERDVASAQRSVNDARDPVARADALYRLQQAQNRLAAEGHQTDQDRLNVLRARRDLMQAQLAIDTAGARAELHAAQDERDRLVTERDDILADKNDQLADINDAERAELRVLQEQLEPLERQRELLQEQKGAVEEELRLLEAQAKPLRDAIDLVLTRLGHEADLTGELDKQLDLLNRIATAGAGRAGAGGAGLGLNPNIGAGLNLNIPGLRRPNDPNESPDGGNPIAPPNIDDTLRALRTKVSNEFKAAIKDGFEQGFRDWDKWDIAWTVIGAGIGAKLGGPLGAALGGAIGKGFGDSLQDLGRWLGRHIYDLMDRVLGENRFGDTIAERLRDLFAPIFDPERWSEFGGWIVEGLWNGIKAAWGAFWDWAGSLWDDFLDRVKYTFGFGSPSRVFHEFGEWIVEGLWNGITAVWNRFTAWIGQSWDDLLGLVEKKLGIEGDESSVFSRIGRIVLTGLKKGAEKVWDETLKPWLVDLPNEAVKALGDVTETLKQKGIDQIEGLFKGLKSKWSDATDGPLVWLSKVGTAAYDAVGDVTRSLWNRGSDLINGLWEGMKSKWTEISSWLGQRAAEAAGLLNPRNWVPDIPGVPKTARDDLPESVKGGNDPRVREEQAAAARRAALGPSEDAPFGYLAGPNGPVPIAGWIGGPFGPIPIPVGGSFPSPAGGSGAASGGSASPFLGGAIGGGWRAPVSGAIGNGGNAGNPTEAWTLNYGGITGILQSIYSDAFGSFTNYTSLVPALESIIGPLDDFLRRLPGLSEEVKNTLNLLIMQAEAARNPASTNYDPNSDPLARIIREALGEVSAVQVTAAAGLAEAGKGLADAGSKLSQAAEELSVSAGAIREGGVGLDPEQALRERREREEEERQSRREPPGTQRAYGGPLPADGWYYGHAGEVVQSVGTVRAAGGGNGATGGGWNGPPIIIETVYGFDDFRARVREATGMDLMARY